MPDTRMQSWEHTAANGDRVLIAAYANIGIGPAIVFEGGAFMNSFALRAFARDLLAGADWLEKEQADRAA
jgi:hypothetical protein